MKKFFAVCAVFVVLIASACSSAPKVQRVNANTQTDLSGFWNDSDVRIVSQSLINDAVNSPRVDQAIKSLGKTPVVIVGRFKNDSSEHIDTSIITSIMEQEIFNSGKMDFVAGGSTRDDLRSERLDQTFSGFVNDGTAASLGNETGADFMLTGSVKTIIDKAGNQTVRTYFVSAELTSIETNQRLWIGQNSEIKKIVVQPRNKL